MDEMMRWLIAILSVAGVVVSALALQVHFSTATEPCSINEKWDCGVVNHSPFGPGAEAAEISVACGCAGWIDFCVTPHVHRGIRFAGLVSVLRDFAGDHCADFAAEFGMAGGRVFWVEARGSACALIAVSDEVA
jgi:hypothetical protein